ncbi:NAD(P)H-dependent oxidoreductase [soil metagenome]
MSTLRSVTLNCTLKPSPAPSSTEVMAALVNDELEALGVTTEVVRIVDHLVKEGVSSDEGDGDEWPGIRQKVLDAQILLLATPIWMGNPSSVARKVLERLDAFLGEEDEKGRVISYDRVAIVATVGNEDGAHNVAAQLYQGLADVGFTIPPNAQAYWVGEAMGSVDFNDLDPVPDQIKSTAKDVAKNAVHLATLLQTSPYPS